MRLCPNADNARKSQDKRCRFPPSFSSYQEQKRWQDTGNRYGGSRSWFTLTLGE